MTSVNVRAHPDLFGGVPKVCRRCRELKPIDEFNACAAARDGRSNWCRDCFSDYNRARYEPHPRPKTAAHIKREARRRASRRWYHRHKHRRAELMRRRTKSWRARNPAKARAQARRGAKVRRARLMGAAVREVVDPAVLWERDGGICGICGRPATADAFDVDHIIPLSKGGDHSYSNTQVSHPTCNRQKGNRIL